MLGQLISCKVGWKDADYHPGCVDTAHTPINVSGGLGTIANRFWREVAEHFVTVSALFVAPIVRFRSVPDARLIDAPVRAVNRVDEARAAAKLLDQSSSDNETPSGTFLQQLIVPERGRKLVMPVNEIDWIEGDTYYVRIHAEGRSRLLRERMQVLESGLNPQHFIRTHRSAIVRLDLIGEIRQDSPFSFSLLLATGARVPVSKSRRHAIEQIIESHR